MEHFQKVELLKESLAEMIHTANYCTKYRKRNKRIWGSNSGEGILGFPAAIILFSVIDCIGSVFLGDESYKIQINGIEHTIKSTSQHIYILNSKYFNLDLSLIDLTNIYKNVRSTLTHNSLLPAGYKLEIGKEEKLPFNITIDKNDKKKYCVNIIPLLKTTKIAVEKFVYDLDNGNIDFAVSTMNKNIEKRDVVTAICYESTNQNN